jgi:hypothetical protein
MPLNNEEKYWQKHNILYYNQINSEENLLAILIKCSDTQQFLLFDNKVTYSEERHWLLCLITHTLKIQVAQHPLQLIHPTTSNRIKHKNKPTIKP